MEEKSVGVGEGGVIEIWKRGLKLRILETWVLNFSFNVQIIELARVLEIQLGFERGAAMMIVSQKKGA